MFSELVSFAELPPRASFVSTPLTSAAPCSSFPFSRNKCASLHVFKKSPCILPPRDYSADAAQNHRLRRLTYVLPSASYIGDIPPLIPFANSLYISTSSLNRTRRIRPGPKSDGQRSVCAPALSHRSHFCCCEIHTFSVYDDPWKNNSIHFSDAYFANIKYTICHTRLLRRYLQFFIPNNLMNNKMSKYKTIIV